MFFLNLLKTIDIFSQPFSFNNKYKTTFGGVSTFLYLILALICILYYFQTVFSHTSPSINYFVQSNQSNLLSESIDDKFLEIQFSSPQIPIDILSKLSLNVSLYKKREDALIPVPYRNCAMPIDPSTLCYRFYFSDYKIYYDTLHDDLDSKIRLYLNYPCVTPVCRNDSSFINNIIKSSLNGFYVDNLFLPTDYSNPTKRYDNQFLSETLNPQHFSSSTIKLKKLILIDDDSMVLDTINHDIRSVNVGLDRSIKDYVYYDGGNSVNVSIIPLANVQLDFFTESADYLLRRYEKIPDALAKIMGILNAFAFLITVLVVLVTDKKRNLSLINQIYDFYDDNDKMDRHRAKRFLERKSCSMIHLKEKLLPMTEVVTEDVEDEVKVIDQTLDLNESFDGNFEGLPDENQGGFTAKKKMLGHSNTIHSKAIMDFKQHKQLEKDKGKGVSLGDNKKKIPKKQTLFVSPMERIEEEPERSEILGRQKSTTVTFRGPRKGFDKSPEKQVSIKKAPSRDFEGNYNTISENENLGSGNERRNNSLIGEILITMNSKKKLTISTWEFLGIMCCIHKCSKSLGRKYELYNQSVEKLQNMLNSDYMMEKLYEVEKIKYLMFNDMQNYAFSFLTKPLILFTDEGKTIVQNDIIKSRKEFKLEGKASKEESIKFLFENEFDCSKINEKLFKLIKVNN